MTRTRDHVGLPSKAKPATLINIRCSEHVRFRCDRGGRLYDRSPHERHTNAFRPTYSLPDRVFSATFLPRRRCFRDRLLCHEEVESSVTSFTNTRASLDLAHVTRIYPSAFLSSSGQFSKVHRALMTEKTGLITPGRMCVRDGVRERGALVIVAGIHRSILPDGRLANETSTFRTSSF